MARRSFTTVHARIWSFVRSPRAVNRSDRTWRTGLHGRAGAGSRPGGGETEIPPATLANTCQKREVLEPFDVVKAGDSNILPIPQSASPPDTTMMFVRTLGTLSSRDCAHWSARLMIAVCNVVKVKLMFAVRLALESPLLDLYSRRLNQHGGVITEGVRGKWNPGLHIETRLNVYIPRLAGRRVWRQEANNRSLSTENTDGIRPFLLACEARSYGSCLGCVNTRNFVRVQHQTICGLVNKAASPNTPGCPTPP
ncbi:hypothetical protein Bbelb_392540 [Branchiostoma belcheri]|nr:hypothetical protein Bbelb_392540 [Branchiostoma belcheri]